MKQTPFCGFNDRPKPLFYCSSRETATHTHTYTHTTSISQPQDLLLIHIHIFSCLPCSQEALTMFSCFPSGGCSTALPPRACDAQSQTLFWEESFFFYLFFVCAFLPPSIPPPGRRYDVVSLNAPLANFCHIYTQTIGVKIELGPQLTLTHAFQHQAEPHAAF